MKDLKIIYCPYCHAVHVLEPQEEIPICCGHQMVLIQAQTEGELEDTHLPVISRKDGQIIAYAGSYPHLDAPDNYIAWLLLESVNGYRLCEFQYGEEPKVCFQKGEAVIAVYAFCTKDGLWKTEI